MAASLREALSSAIEEEETKDVPAAIVETAAPVESAPTDIAAASDTSTDADTPPAEAPAPEAAPKEPAPVETKPQTAEEKEAARLHRIDRAPSSWKKEAKGEWAALPVHIRQEVHKREAEINRVLQQSAPDRQLAEQFKQTVTPFMARIQANGIDPVTAAKNLFEADHRLSTGHPRDRAQYLAQLIMEYGISVEDLDTALAPLVQGRQAQPAAPAGGVDIAAIVQQQLSQALAPIMQERQQAQQRSQQQVEQTIEQMALDPKYPFFEDVRVDMADLIDLSARKGIPLSLEEAYNRAVRMNPDTYGQMERQVTVSAAQQAHQAAQRAKAAGSSISGSPAGGGGQSNTGDGSLRGAIEAAFGGQRL